jgi:hypothetical protein
LRYPKRLALAGAAAAFCVIAILNCGGYRYGIGDQAFYVPAVVQHLDPSLFPRDRVLLHAQDRFMLFDDLIAGAARLTSTSVPALFFVAYLGGMVGLFGAAVAIGRVMYRSWWTIACLLALLSLRHRITQTGANTLEAYFQPRMLAFCLGAWAIAAFLRGKSSASILLVAGAFTVHPTTGLWFGAFMAAALAVSQPRWRVPLAGAAAAGVAVAIWMIAEGPLRGHLVTMDPLWASAMAGKDYIFPSSWKTSFWLANLGYVPVIFGIQWYRRHRREAVSLEHGLAAGSAALVLLFLISVPLMSAGLALAIQFQTSRVFWILDFVASIYIAWVIVEAHPTRTPLARQITVIVVVALALARGTYVTRAEHAGNAIVRIEVPHNNWADAMSWIARTRHDSHVLADPGHAWKYGTSVRVTGERDTYFEDVKDRALALYSRGIAMRVIERARDTQNFDAMTPAQLRSLAARQDLDYLVAERKIDLPVVYSNGQFRIYSLHD